MIISASRRTDLPAFYSSWFINRIRAGFCMVPNPYNSKQISRVSLLPQDVEALVFWSKNPAPLLGHITELTQRGFKFYFLFTLTNYGPDLEPRVPPLDERLRVFAALSERLGPSRVIWRYDPIVLSNRTSWSFHHTAFKHLTKRLAGKTSRVIISLVHYYQKTERRFSGLEQSGYHFNRNAWTDPTIGSFLGTLCGIANEFGMEMQACAQEQDLSNLGIDPSSCVDGRLIRDLWGQPGSIRKDPGQRQTCRCTISRDIGVNDTCLHGCRYCYATRDPFLAKQRHQVHHPDNPMLYSGHFPRKT